MTFGMRPYWYDEEYSAIILGTTRSPGVVTLTGHDRFENWDIQAPKGSSGASSTLNGRTVGQFQASFHLVGDRQDGEPDQFDEWESFQRLIESMTAGPSPIALPIYHPDLARNGFTEVSSGGVGGFSHDGRGGVVVVVRFVEYRPPKTTAITGATPAPSGRTGTTVLVPPDPNAAAKAQLAALLEEAKQP